jgi:excisionase family DNA binding protein
MTVIADGEAVRKVMEDTVMVKTVDATPPAAAEGFAALLCVDDVAKLLRCSPRTVYRLSDAGRMPAPCRLGALVRWPRAAIDGWIAAGCPACRAERKR